MKYKRIQVGEIRVLKSGSNKRGSWTLWLIKDHDGNEYTTFDNLYTVGKTHTIKYTEEVEGTFLQRKIINSKRSSKEGKLEGIEVSLRSLENRIHTVEDEGIYMDKFVSLDEKVESLEVSLTDIEKTVELLREIVEGHIEHSAPHG